MISPSIAMVTALTLGPVLGVLLMCVVQAVPCSESDVPLSVFITSRKAIDRPTVIPPCPAMTYPTLEPSSIR